MEPISINRNMSEETKQEQLNKIHGATKHMTDVELNALCVLANADLFGMKSENEFRLRDGYAMAYFDIQFSDNEYVLKIRDELRDRGVINEP